mgnify:CR=1 FL=1
MCLLYLGEEFDAIQAPSVTVQVVELDGNPALERLVPGVEVVHLDAATALGEYLDDHGLRTITSRLRSSGVIDVVASASPGIDDLEAPPEAGQVDRGRQACRSAADHNNVATFPKSS